MRPTARWLLSFLLAPAAAAQVAPMPAPPPVAVTGAWARATLPHQTISVVYMTLQSPNGDVLTAAGSPDAGMAMLHKTLKTGTMQHMQDVESIPLPARQAVALAPNGTHIMLMDLTHPLTPGGTLHLVLHFARAGAQTVEVPIRPVGAIGP